MTLKRRALMHNSSAMKVARYLPHPLWKYGEEIKVMRQPPRIHPGGGGIYIIIKLILAGGGRGRLLEKRTERSANRTFHSGHYRKLKGLKVPHYIKFTVLLFALVFPNNNIRLYPVRSEGASVLFSICLRHFSKGVSLKTQRELIPCSCFPSKQVDAPVLNMLLRGCFFVFCFFGQPIFDSGMKNKNVGLEYKRDFFL